MKQVINSIMLTVLMSMVTTKAFAYAFYVENNDGVIIFYNYINDGTELEVARSNGSYEGEIVIPSEVTYMNRTRKVTAIGEGAFYDCYALKSVTIPNSVKTIGGGAFSKSEALESVTIPNSVTSIGSSAFSYCHALTSLTIPNSVTDIGDYTFNHCSGLTSITISNNVESIGISAFEGCFRLTSVTIPNNIRTIGRNAFRDCLALSSITIPNNVTTIGESAFEGCRALTSVTIGNSVTFIGEYAFYGADIPTVISKIVSPFAINGLNTFSRNTFINASLYVPKGTKEKYKTTEGWKNFSYIEEGDGGSAPPDTKKCATPTIGYNKGKLTYNCDTEGAVCQTTITDTDITSFSGNEIDLTVTYNISVYATKEGYENSDVATATLCWIDVDPKTDGITNVTHVEARAVMIKSYGGQLSIEGADDNTDITAYSLDGVQLGSAVSRNGVATINMNVSAGTVTIVKIGNKSVKVVMK